MSRLVKPPKPVCQRLLEQCKCNAPRPVLPNRERLGRGTHKSGKDKTDNQVRLVHTFAFSTEGCGIPLSHTPLNKLICSCAECDWAGVFHLDSREIPCFCRNLVINSEMRLRYQAGRNARSRNRVSYSGTSCGKFSRRNGRNTAAEHGFKNNGLA